MKSRKFLFLLLGVIIFVNLYSKELSKKYFNLPFNGGLPKIFSEMRNANFKKSYAYYRIDLFSDYAKIHCLFKIENKGEKTQLTFAYPSIACKYSQIKNENNQSQTTNYEYRKNYYNFLIKINGQKINYIKKSDNIIETALQYKYGETISMSKKGLRLEQYPGSYLYYYNWNEVSFTLDEKEKKTITLDYIVPLYYNEIKGDESDIQKYKDNIFSYKYNKNTDSYLGEKLFVMLFNTTYSFLEKPFNKCKVKLYSHIIDKSFYFITPTNYKNKGIVYTWYYKNFTPKKAHNILIKIQNKKNSHIISSADFVSTPPRKKGKFSWYHKFNMQSSPSIILERDDEKPFKIRQIRMSSEDFSTKAQLKKSNLPLKFLISFSNKKDFSDSVQFTRKIKKKTFYKSVNKRAYITIFKTKKTLQYKYIKILLLNTTNKDHDNKNETIKINEFVILN